MSPHAEYIAVFSRGEAPIAALARMRQKPTTTIRSLIARTRRKGYLTEAPKHGKGGGQLTMKALAILDGESALQRIPKHGGQGTTGTGRTTQKSPPIPTKEVAGITRNHLGGGCSIP